MTTFLAAILVVLMILVGVGLIAFDIFARVFNNMYNRMFTKKPARYGYGTLVFLLLLYVVLKSWRTHH